MPGGLSVTLTKKDIAPALLLRLRTELAGARARAGIIGSKADQKHEGSGATNAEIAAAHEFGATMHHPGGTPYMIGSDGLAVFLKKGDPRATGVTRPHDIVLPERSFLRTAIDQNRAKYAELLAKGLRGVIDGKTTARKVFQMLALTMAQDIKNGILSDPGIQPPDSPATIRRKEELRAAGNTLEPRTLVDSGQLVNAITGVAETPGG